MQTIPLQPIPNQSFSLQLGSNNYDIRLRTCESGVTSVDVIINNIPLLSGQRAVSNFPVIAYEYLTDGNFMFITQNDEYPDYTQFGVTQFLIFADRKEIEAINGA